MTKLGDHALVIGASMGGLLAARVLSERFARVTILERDELDGGLEPRRGIPQGRHAHGLLASGARALEALFPGLREDVIALDGRPADIADDCLWHNFGGYLKAEASDLKGFLVSRPALEEIVRRRVRALPNVTLRDRVDVIGLTHEGGCVTGVEVKSAGAQTIAADLVLDASGRGGRAAFWLDELGYAKPQEERVEVGIHYTTRWFKRAPHHLPGREAIVLAADPAHWRPSVILSQEGGRWVVVLSGYRGETPPEDLDGFRAYAKSLPTPEIYDVVADAEPIGEAIPYAFKNSVRRRYDKLKGFPRGLLVFGDALASFNPVYGQGMSVAACEAMALRDCLAQGAEGLARRFFKQAARVVDTPWSIAVGADLAHPAFGKAPPLPARIANAWVEKVFRAGHKDARVAQAFLQVANLVAPPTSLFRPATVWRTLRANAGRPVAEPAPKPAWQA